MSSIEKYRAPEQTVPRDGLAWNMYGPGLDNVGRNGQPERVPVSQPGPDQLLVRIDSVGMCFSDLKILSQGGAHPKLYGRDLKNSPTRLGHEVALTIVAVGETLRARFAPGQRWAVQPDIYQNGKSMAYGYTVPGGLTQFHLMGPEVLVSDDGPCLLRLPDDMGYAETALLEPWGCVMAAYTQRRRLQPKPGGIMWIVGRPDDKTKYSFTTGHNAPATTVLTDAPASLVAQCRNAGVRVEVRDGISPADYPALAREFTGEAGWDDIVMLDPRSAGHVSDAAKLVARRGVLNLVGRTALDGPSSVDVGRLHYDYIAFVGNPGPDISASYGEARNRCELRAGGTTIILGAGGPMGQMHLQRALEHPQGPQRVVATEMNAGRLGTLHQRFMPIAKANGRDLYIAQPGDPSLQGLLVDDAVVCVPSAKLMAEAAAMLKPDGMLVLFAGVPNGTLAPVNLSNVYLGNAQYTGTSGLTIHDQALVLQSSRAQTLSPARSVAAIGGMSAARDALQATVESRYSGKIVIFPQIEHLPLMSLEALRVNLPHVAAKLGPDDLWTREAEQALIEGAWTPPA